MTSVEVLILLALVLAIAALSLVLAATWLPLRTPPTVAAPPDAELAAVRRYAAYIGIIRTIWGEMGKDRNLAPAVIAGVRRLRDFPEYGDITVLMVDEINVTGSSHFDSLLKQEIGALQTFLLNQHAS